MFRPLLAQNAELGLVKYPVLGSYKLDGIRALVKDGKLVSRKLLPIPNSHIRALFERIELDGLDGELIAGQPFGEGVFNRSTRTVMKDGADAGNVMYYVFDKHNVQALVFKYRLELLRKQCEGVPHIQVLEQRLLENEQQLLEFEEHAVATGYEGIMIRSPVGPYKFGRSTANEGILLKVKRFADSECRVLQVFEEMKNNNVETKDALGHTKRSTSKAGKTASGKLGGFLVEDLESGVQFRIGGGWDEQQAAEMWERHQHGQLIGTVHTYKYQKVGVLNKPRFPQWKGERAQVDLP